MVWKHVLEFAQVCCLGSCFDTGVCAAQVIERYWLPGFEVKNAGINMEPGLAFGNIAVAGAFLTAGVFFKNCLVLSTHVGGTLEVHTAARGNNKEHLLLIIIFQHLIGRA